MQFWHICFNEKLQCKKLWWSIYILNLCGHFICPFAYLLPDCIVTCTFSQTKNKNMTHKMCTC